jgi:homoserine O-acetyltransferase/O-succinyltransferase
VNYGSTGPLDEGWPAGAKLTVGDQARALWQALEALGVDSLQLATGGSLGGRIALAMAAQRPDAVAALMPIGAALSVTAWVAAFTHLQRQLIETVPGPRGLELARQLAMVTYRAEAGLEATQPMTAAPPPGKAASRVEGYLEHQGVKLVERFDARAYLALLDAMDTVDLGLTRWAGRAQVVDIDTDQLFTTAQVDALGAALTRAGARVERATIHSPHGHDAFLIEWDQLRPIVARAMALAGVAL